MKLQIVEYTITGIKGKIHYRYMLGLDEKPVLCTGSYGKPTAICTGPYETPTELKTVYEVLLNKLLDENKDYNLKHIRKFNVNMVPGQVIFEKEVSDTFLKELYVEKSMKAIQEDFT